VKKIFAEGPAYGPRQRLFIKKLAEKLGQKKLCRGPNDWPSAKPDGSGRAALGKDLFCRGPVFVVEGCSLPMAPGTGPQQRVSLPSVRDLALDKASCPRQSTRFQ
jgi:hypothetical protein